MSYELGYNSHISLPMQLRVAFHRQRIYEPSVAPFVIHTVWEVVGSPLAWAVFPGAVVPAEIVLDQGPVRR